MMAQLRQLTRINGTTTSTFLPKTKWADGDAFVTMNTDGTFNSGKIKTQISEFKEKQYMKPTHLVSGFLLLLVLLAIGGVIADRVIPQDPEIQGLSTSTSMNVQGIATENDGLAWLNSNRGGLGNTSLLLPSHLVADTTGTLIFDVPGLYPVYDAMYGS